ncbi:maltose alpha-D-glucosyltransferase domain protein [Mycobacterium kansasii]|uniref:Maltose alpha-D-glucosyltransferase domain protein n=1 Tax=Mycobacterium kansasii TaxID=1768 RepID=A0A1V3W9J0_MYCKA|nr:maltose alpha-D-glucosyltransferase domain protein [Mycobacterium kansasii]
MIWLGAATACGPRCSDTDRNAGFSTANPGRLYLPPSQDPVYGYQAVNVEAQRDTSTSLLNWTRTMLAVRRRHQAFAVGSFQEWAGPTRRSWLSSGNAGSDGRDGDVVLCVNNSPGSAAHRAEPAAMEQLHTDRAHRACGISRIGHLPYLLTLPGHGFYWFQLSRTEENA